ncbi:MAG: hypothetical protein AAF355_16025 [Myxococcota bacterium]
MRSEERNSAGRIAICIGALGFGWAATFSYLVQRISALLVTPEPTPSALASPDIEFFWRSWSAAWTAGAAALVIYVVLRKSAIGDRLRHIARRGAPQTYGRYALLGTLAFLVLFFMYP